MHFEHLIDKKREAIKSLLSDGSGGDDALESQGSIFLLGSTAADGFDAADYPEGTELPNQVSFPIHVWGRQRYQVFSSPLLEKG